MAARIVVFKAGNNAALGGDLQDLSIAALNAIRGSTALPEGHDQLKHSRLLPGYIPAANRNSHPNQYGGM